MGLLDRPLALQALEDDSIGEELVALVTAASSSIVLLILDLGFFDEQLEVEELEEGEARYFRELDEAVKVFGDKELLNSGDEIEFI